MDSGPRLPALVLPIACGAAGGALLIFSFPRFNLFPLAWIALVPWLALLPRLTFKQALLSSLSLGFVFFAGLLYWVAIFGYLPWLLLALFQALFVVAAGLGLWFCRGLSSIWRIAAAPSLWITFEWLRGCGPFGFTWGWLGYSQSPWLDLLQLAAITGPLGLSFLILLHNAALAEAVRSLQMRRRSVAPLAAAWGVIVAIVLIGHYWLRPQAALPSNLKVAIVQPSNRELEAEEVNRVLTLEELRPGFALLARLSAQAAAGKPDLIVWPESALPIFLNQDREQLTWIGQLARETQAWLLLGAAFENAAGEPQNSTYLFSPQGDLVGHSEKVQLVPFGEFVPARDWLPGLKNYPMRDYDLVPGRDWKPLAAGSIRPGVSICFESIFPRISRRLTGQGANLLLVITNDGWFRNTAAPAQHRQMAVFRAVENRRWVVRAALTGISCFISPAGRITQQLGLHRSGVIIETVGVGEGKTFYLRHGDWFVVLAALLAVSCLFMSGKQTRYSSRRTKSVSPDNA